MADVRAGHALHARGHARSPRHAARPLHAAVGPGRSDPTHVSARSRRQRVPAGGSSRPCSGRSTPTGSRRSSRSTGHRAGRTAATRRTGSRRAGSATSPTQPRSEFPWVHLWTVWNEPNGRTFSIPVSPRAYVRQLLNPAYASLHQASSANVVAGGVTSPRKTASGMSPLAFMEGMKAAGARLDAYAQNPYPISRRRDAVPFDLRRLHRADDGKPAGGPRRRHSHLRRGQAAVADGVRLPDESARPSARRVVAAAGALHR